VREKALPGDGMIDVLTPVKCAGREPTIRALWGGVDRDRGWSQSAFSNANNHSVVTRIDFGKASVLVTGDLQEEGIRGLLARYQGTSLLDVDVYQDGHHGSHNATTENLLRTITPLYALIAMGPSTRELSWTAWAYGHPRKEIVEMLRRHVRGTRPPTTVPVATGQHMKGLIGSIAAR
jgi:competence protein ComEC